MHWKTLYVPKMLDKERGIMDFLQIFGEDDLRSLPSGQWGIREPDLETKGKRRPTALDGNAEPLDLIVMPVALALREQILEAGQVPVGETDWRVDVIIGPDEIVT
ncbi:hypothetical protein ACG7TL_009062 [Trametes sanguinea]